MKQEKLVEVEARVFKGVSMNIQELKLLGHTPPSNSSTAMIVVPPLVLPKTRYEYNMWLEFYNASAEKQVAMRAIQHARRMSAYFRGSIGLHAWYAEDLHRLDPLTQA